MRNRSLCATTTIAIAVFAMLLPAALGAAPSQRTLRVWNFDEKTAVGIAWDYAIKQFEASHPGIKIQHEEKGYEQIRQTGMMILNSDEAPDLLLYPKGNATAGLASRQGLMTDLSSEAAKRGWNKILSPSVQAVCRYDENGVMGSGKWYGVTDYGEYVMVYYNKDMFKKYGVKVPKTFAEFEMVMDQFVKAGITPMATSAIEYPANQVFYELSLTKADRKFVDAFQLFKGEVNFQGPEFTFGAERLLQWVKNGYVSKDATSQKAEDMGIAFETAKAPLMITGTWWYGRLVNEIKDFDWGTFLLPGGRMHQGSGGHIWVVPAKSKNKDIAYDFIDLTLTKDVQTVMGNNGGIPVNADLSKITDSKFQELIANFMTIMKDDGLSYYADWPVPGFYDVLNSAMQELISGTKTPHQILADLNNAYSEGRK